MATGPYRPDKYLLGRDKGLVFPLNVPDGSEIAFDVNWDLPQVMIVLRLTQQGEYNAWLYDPRRDFIPWATLFGMGFLRGQIAPPFSGAWVALIDAAPAAWPPGRAEPLELNARIEAIGPSLADIYSGTGKVTRWGPPGTRTGG